MKWENERSSRLRENQIFPVIHNPSGLEKSPQ